MFYFLGNNNSGPNLLQEDGVQWRGSRGSAINGSAGSGFRTDQDRGFYDHNVDSITESNQLERSRSTENDPIHLKRRVGLVSGVALIVGTMIGM